MPLTPSQRTLDEDSSPSFCGGRKLGEVEQALLWTLLHEDPECPSRVLLDRVAQRQRPMAVSIRHLNRWRVTWQCNRRRGRPRQSVSRSPVPSQGGVVVSPLRAGAGARGYACTWSCNPASASANRTGIDLPVSSASATSKSFCSGVRSKACASID